MSDKVKAGKYKLVAARWRKITSKPGEPLDYIQYRKGDKVDLDVEDARRLLKAGAVKPIGKDETPEPTGGGGDGSSGGSSGGEGDAKPTSVKDILKDVGDDKAKAQAYLDAEQAAEEPRVSLVKGLQAVLAAE